MAKYIVERRPRIEELSGLEINHPAESLSVFGTDLPLHRALNTAPGRPIISNDLLAEAEMRRGLHPRGLDFFLERASWVNPWTRQLDAIPYAPRRAYRAPE